MISETKAYDGAIHRPMCHTEAAMELCETSIIVESHPCSTLQFTNHLDSVHGSLDGTAKVKIYQLMKCLAVSVGSPQ